MRKIPAAYRRQRTGRAQGAELARRRARGARGIRQAGDEPWHVLAVPEGNGFSLLKGRLSPLCPRRRGPVTRTAGGCGGTRDGVRGCKVRGTASERRPAPIAAPNGVCPRVASCAGAAPVSAVALRDTEIVVSLCLCEEASRCHEHGRGINLSRVFRMTLLAHRRHLPSFRRADSCNHLPRACGGNRRFAASGGAHAPFAPPYAGGSRLPAHRAGKASS